MSEKVISFMLSATHNNLINLKWFRGGLVFKAHRLLHHSTVGLRVIKKYGRYILSEKVISSMSMFVVESS